MTAMDLRVRILGALLRRVLPMSEMTREQVLRAQRRERNFKHNPVSTWLQGSIAAGVVLEDKTIDGPGGALSLRVYRTAGERPALIVFFHGGGWTVGSLGPYDSLCSQVSSATDAVVVSVNYRLAPTHPFPAAVDDCYAAFLWAAEHADDLGADGRRLGVMGDSAGGNLAAAVALLVRDRSGPQISHQALVYPCTDLTLSASSLRSNANKPILPAADVFAYRRHYLGDPPASARDPRASPLLAEDHRGLPPALIQVAEHDPLRDDGTRYADALRAADVPVRLTEYVGMPHGFIGFPRWCRSAPQALAEICAEQLSALADGSENR
jgi:acetyl esterase/lipase